MLLRRLATFLFVWFCLCGSLSGVLWFATGSPFVSVFVGSAAGSAALFGWAVVHGGALQERELLAALEREREHERRAA